MKEQNPLTTEFLSLIRTERLPSLGPEIREGVADPASLEERTRVFCRDHSLGAVRWLQSAALLWHDHLESSHELSQDIPSAEGSFLHGIMHRREPDNGNAKYWFRKVGRHACHPRLAKAAGERIEGSLREDLIPGGRWDPMAFTDACTGADRSDANRYRTLQEIQEIEFRILVDHVIGTDPS